MFGSTTSRYVMQQILYFLIILLVAYCHALSPLAAILNRRNSTALNGGCALGRYPYTLFNTTQCAECYISDAGWFTVPASKTQYCARSEPYSAQLTCTAVTALAPMCALGHYCDSNTLTCIDLARTAPRCDVTRCPTPLICDARTNQCVAPQCNDHHVLDAQTAYRCVEGTARPVSITWSELSALPRHLLTLLISVLVLCCLVALSINISAVLL